MLIGLTGKKQSGKDTAADWLVRRFGFTKIAFADPVRKMAYDINPIVGAHVDFEGNTVTGVQYVYLREMIDEYGWDKAKVLCREIRRFLQRLGTEGVRENIDRRAWVEIAVKELTRYWEQDYMRDRKRRPIVISDVRLPEEHEFVRSRGGVIVKIEREGQPEDNSELGTHVSESGVPYDYLIKNPQGSLKEMHAQLTELVKSLG